MSCCERSRILHVSTGRTYDVEALPGLLHACGHEALKARLQCLMTAGMEEPRERLYIVGASR